MIFMLEYGLLYAFIFQIRQGATAQLTMDFIAAHQNWLFSTLNILEKHQPVIDSLKKIFCLQKKTFVQK